MASSRTQYVKDARAFYRITLRFMDAEWPGELVLANNAADEAGASDGASPLISVLDA